MSIRLLYTIELMSGIPEVIEFGTSLLKSTVQNNSQKIGYYSIDPGQSEFYIIKVFYLIRVVGFYRVYKKVLKQLLDLLLSYELIPWGSK